MIILSFGLFLLGFVTIGLLSSLKNRHSNVDYLLAGQNVKPWLVGLSAAATNSSGYMFIGMIGFTYTTGLSSIWLMIGWVAGDFISSTFIHKRLRITAEKSRVLSYAGILSHWHGNHYRILRIIAGTVTVSFLGLYAAAQLGAGSKALQVLFGWNYSIGAIIGATIVLLYCFAGGIRASIWTDAAQSVVMILAMGLLVVTTITEIGGIPEFITALDAVSVNYLSLIPSAHPVGGISGLMLFILGWMFAGFGVIGQPHIMGRFMTLDRPQNIGHVKIYYYSWYTTFYALTICTGLAARVLLPEIDSFDPELALPTIAQNLLPDVLIGLVLAGLFAATMSTADSQILSCTAALTRDFSSERKVSYLMTKLATVSVVLIALTLALNGNQSIFTLVLIAWAALAAAFAPLLIVYALGGKPSQPLAIAMMIGGLGAMLSWRFLEFSGIINDIAPGMITGLAIFCVGQTIPKFALTPKTAQK